MIIHNQDIEHPDSDYIILAGPTAVGKTALVMDLAKQYDVEIISGDSRQIYRHMNIGTATPEAQELERLPHHLLNELNPDVVWNAADFYQRARQLIVEILERGNLPIVVGGAGMYLDALRFGLFDEQAKNPDLRRKYQGLIDGGEAESLWEGLRKIDPEYAETFHHNNHKKLMRAYEIYESTGMIPSKVFAQHVDPFEKRDVFIVLDRQRELLYERIDQRVLDMFANGLIDECRKLLELGYSPDLYPMRTIGYKEVFAFLAGNLEEDDMVALIQKNTRNFAKRQLTWFRNHPYDHWINLDN
ncbi:MAG: tRNA (adenosine(37)-N6)-dimethylallyltransferase MiaA [Candidatus Marinimicrobia bacterium]|nr:tRNA (adenosine(37)-N6)-dimethylallyltransferase MiaA [Candidatus Neomarinimicrobiota bacterium]